MPLLKSSIEAAGGIYKRYAASLEKLGIVNFEDFLFHIPFRYDDYSIISKINQLQPGEVVTIRGKVIDIKNQYTRRHFVLQTAKIEDETGIIEIVWFNQPYIAKTISKGDFISLSGKIEQKLNKLVMQSPDYEIVPQKRDPASDGRTSNFIHTGRLVPVYNETRGVSSKWLRRQVFKLLNENKNELVDFLPKEIVSKHKLQEFSQAIQKAHFPDNLGEVTSAIKRLSFDELFLMQASANVRKEEWDKELKSNPFEIKKFKTKIDTLTKTLPFTLTHAQTRTLEEVFSDLALKKPMNRLLEGDVGSGKTIVAGISMYLAHLNGFQSILMAPTEILANQHYKTISNLLSPFGLKISLRTSANKKNEIFDILVGTHAVISESVKLTKLGFVVIDEQQRFGVEQRTILRKKGDNPHVLTMTATPIPRTIALTMYGDLDLSILDEMPRGRKEIKTWLVPNVKRNNAYDWIKKQIDANKSQVFIVCPFIEESESLSSVKAAAKEFDDLQKNVFEKYKLALIHGKLKSKEKNEILQNFKEEKCDILIATPVVEVGIDIPNADIIIIEASERFGLSQLHQLRGRVGRNDRQAYCLLFTESSNPLTQQRLKAMEKTNIGAELAELDLRMRGPGEIYGTRQSGRNFLKIASFSDFDLIKQTKEEAGRITPMLSKYPKLLEKIKEINIKQVSPD
ncbi:MAG: ATP-dependent DNA helicase [uncultured bacterium]|nr:MAG: ATP-dependent DNA helicase [uncultured bacterium]